MAQTSPEPDASAKGPWTIQLPFFVSPGKEITLGDAGHQGKIGDWECLLEKKPHFYVLNILGIPEKGQAEEFVNQLGGSLLWSQVSISTGMRFDLTLDEPHYPADPQAAARNLLGKETERLAEVLVSGNNTTVYPSDKQKVTCTANPVSVKISISPNQLLAAIDEGISLKHGAEIPDNRRITLACDLYSLSHFETSARSRFLNQMAALESLAERPHLPDGIVGLVDKWAHDIQEEEGKSPNLSESEAFRRLRSRVEDLKRESITESVRILVRKSLVDSAEDSVEEYVSRIGPLYGVRSRIAHGDAVDLGQSPVELEAIVRKTLFAVMKNPNLIG